MRIKLEPCPACGQEKWVSGDIPTRVVQGCMRSVCTPCAARLDKANKKQIAKQNEADEAAAAKMKAKADAEEAAKPKPVDLNNAMAMMAQAMTMIAGQNQQIINLLTPKAPDVQETTSKARTKRR